VCNGTEYKLSVLRVKNSVENELNPTTQQFITAEVSGFALKQRSKAHVTASEQFATAK